MERYRYNFKWAANFNEVEDFVSLQCAHGWRLHSIIPNEGGFNLIFEAEIK